MTTKKTSPLKMKSGEISSTLLIRDGKTGEIEYDSRKAHKERRRGKPEGVGDLDLQPQHEKKKKGA